MDLLDIVRILQVVFGVGLVIFVHELGHFLAARRCGVRVEVFSLGFGPKLLAWTRGDTTYQVALVPLGGYVKMAGEELEGEGGAPASDELGSKTVGQRFLIFAGGVIMNALFAIVVFPLILLAGVPFEEPLVGATVPGSPAWHADLEPGTRIHEIGSRKIRTFDQILTAAALSGDEEVKLVVQRPESETRETVTIESRYDSRIGIRRLGIRPALEQRDGGHTVAVRKDSAAHEAGLRDGDVIVAVETEYPELDLHEQVTYALLEQGPVNLEILRDGSPLSLSIEPRKEEVGDAILGVGPASRVVHGLRETEQVREVGLSEGDLLLRIGDQAFWGTDLIPLLLDSAGSPLVLTVERADERLVLEGPTLDREGLLELARSIALEAEPDSNRVIVSSGSAAALAGMQSGDRITMIDGGSVDEFSDVQELVPAATKGDAPIQVGIARDIGGEAPEFLELTVKPTPRNSADYGFDFKPATYVYQEKNPIRAVQVGMVFCWSFLEDTWRTLRGIATQDVSGKNVGGIITIGVAAHSFANSGWAKLFFFLCVLSMNLAFLNILPIPLLDGGHLFFLLIEKLKGSPVSERVMGYSQLVGLVLILSLFVYVMHNDIQRFILR